MCSEQMPIPCNAESWNAVALKPSRVRTAAIAIPSTLPLGNCSYYSHREKGKQLSASELLLKPSTFLDSIFYAELQNGP